MTRMTRRGRQHIAAIAVVALLVGLALFPPWAGERSTAGRPASIAATGGPHPQLAQLTGEGPRLDTARVVLARMFQHDHWTIDAVAAGANQDKINYLCAALTPLKPTYVSGLIRLNGNEPITNDQVEIFQGVQSCLPGARLDVALNAEDYLDGTGANLPNRLRQIRDVLRPDGWFFDFLTKPWQAGKATNMQAGLRWSREHNMFVGGNVWGAGNIPDHVTFVAVTTLGGVSQAGRLAERINRDRPDLSVLLHIRNDPQVDQSEGLRWINASRQRRAEILHDHVASIARYRFDAYMYPVFFPLSCQRPVNATRGCAGGDGATHRSYDARADRLLRRICLNLGRDANRCAEVPNP